MPLRRPRHLAVVSVLSQMNASVLRAATAFLEPERAEYRRRCFSGLDVEAPERLLDGVRQILSDLGPAPA